jgi:predicted nucleotidyltransferase
MVQLTERELKAILAEFSPGSVGLLLTGSYARGDAAQYSDVDIIRFVPDGSETLNRRFQYLERNNKLISITATTINEKEQEIDQPQSAIMLVPALQQGIVIFDPQGQVTALQQKALQFEWLRLQAAAQEYVSNELLEFVEEVYTIINALKREDESAAMIGLLGLCLGMPRIIAVHLGLMIPTENDLFKCVQQAVGNGSSWTRYFRQANGMVFISEQNTVFKRAQAGLILYVETKVITNDDILPQHVKIINQALINIELFFNK